MTSEEITRATLLRALEWCAWPVFLCQPLLPLLYLLWPPYVVAPAVLLLAWLWVPVTKWYVSYCAATLGCIWVRLKWPVMLVAATYFLWKHSVYLAILTLCTPVIPQLLVRLVPKADFLGIQRKMMAQIGFDPDQQELNRATDELKTVLKSLAS